MYNSSVESVATVSNNPHLSVHPVECSTSEPEESDPEPILIVVLGGKQTFKLKLKHDEMPGAKVSLFSVTFGQVSESFT